MKRIITYIILILIFIFLGYIGMTNQPVELPSETILGVSYYKYNVTTGEFSSITFDENRVLFIGSDISLSGCSSYTYQESTGIVKMDCGRAFRLIIPAEGVIVLNIDNTNYYFYKDTAKSYEREFQNTFEMTLSDYEFEGNEKLENITIDINTFNEFMNSDVENYIYVRNEVCTNECILLSNSVTDLSGTKNIYYIKYSELPEEIINKIIEKDKDFITSTSPKILVIGNGQINDVITVPVTSFDINLFIGYLDDYNSNDEVENDEEN